MPFNKVELSICNPFELITFLPSTSVIVMFFKTCSPISKFQIVQDGLGYTLNLLAKKLELVKATAKVNVPVNLVRLH